MEWGKVLGRGLILLGIIMYGQGLLLFKMKLMICGFGMIVLGLYESSELPDEFRVVYELVNTLFEDVEACFCIGFLMGMLSILVILNDIN